MSQLHGWICLVLVAAATAYGVQLTVVALARPAATPDQATSATVTRKVLIVAVDEVTGNRTQMECDAPVNSFATDVLLVDANELPASARACTIAGGPA
jgi:hypothetical protein